MPLINKASIGSPMVLQPTVATKTGMVIKNPSAISLASKSSASLPLLMECKTHKVPPFTPSTPSFLRRELKSNDEDTSASVLRPNVAAKTPFPTSTSDASTERPPPVPPKDAPRPRHHSKASLSSIVNSITPRKGVRFNSTASVASPKDVSFTTEQRDPISVDSFNVFATYTSLIEACKAGRVDMFAHLSNSYLEALDSYLQDLDSQLTSPLSKSTHYLLAKSDYDFCRRVLRSSVEAIPSSEHRYRVYDTSRALWDSVSRVLQSLQRQDTAIPAWLEEQLSATVQPQWKVHFDDTQEVAEVAAILASSFKSSSTASIKSAKRSLSNYFQKFSLSRASLKTRKTQGSHVNLSTSPQIDPSEPRNSDASASSSSSSSSTLVSRPRPQKTTVTSDPLSYHRFGLRESHIFFNAASSFVANIPSPGEDTGGKPIPAFKWEWLVPLPNDQGIYSKVGSVSQNDKDGIGKGVLVTGSFECLLRYVLENIDDPENIDFLDAFLMFFRSYATPRDLFDTLFRWYKTMSPAARVFVGSHKVAFRRRAKTQIIKVLARWLEHYWQEDADATVRKLLLEFTHDVVANDTDLVCDLASILAVSLCRTAQHRVTHLTRKFQLQVTKAEQDQQSYPPTQFSLQLEHMTSMVRRNQNIKHVDILEFCHEGGTEELARAFTLLESEYFHKFLPESIAGWRGRNFEELKPWDIFVNTSAFWTVACVIRHQNEKDRIAAYELMVDVARSCKSMRNFSTAKNIACALEMRPITRLIGTVEGVSQYHRECHAQLMSFFVKKDKYLAEITQTRPAVPLPETIRYGVVKSDAEAKKHPEADRVKQSGFMDMIYYEKIARFVRALENVYGAYSIPRQVVVLQWVEAIRRPFEHYSWDENEERLFSESCSIVPQSSEEKRKPRY